MNYLSRIDPLTPTTSAISRGLGTPFNFGALGSALARNISSNTKIIQLSIHDISEPKKTVEILKDEIILLKANKDNKIVQFSALGFKKPEDAQVLIQKSPPAMQFVLLADVYYVSMMVVCL